MQKRLSFWIATSIALSMWIAVIWGIQVQAKERPVVDSVALGVEAPVQQTCSQCNSRPDLQIKQINIEPESPNVDQPYNVHVEILNACAENDTVDTWTYLYVDRTPTGNPDVQAHAPTAGLGTGETVWAHLTVTQGHATAGWHTISVLIDATDAIRNEACNGEDNNSSALSFEITGVIPPTPLPPTATPFQPPVIHFFTPEEAEVARGDPVTLKWQVGGDAVSVYLDDVLMPAAHSYEVRPTEGHVYTLRAQNPGGSVQASSRITVVDPTPTPTPTETPCNYPTIHEFGSSPASVNRGEKVTIFWDVADANEVYLNDQGVPGVSSKTFTLKQTTVFTLMARNACGEVEETLTVQANYATPTPSFTPTLTRTPTRTSTPTYTPHTPTPTRNVLPTRTFTPVPTVTPTGTLTPGHAATPTNTFTPVPTVTGTRITTPTATTVQATGSPTPTPTVPAFDSPIGTPSQTPIPSIMPTSTSTLTPVPTVTWTPTPTSTVNPVIGPADTAIALNPTATMLPTLGPADPTITPTPVPPVGAMRMYLCPLSVLLVFAVGVLVLSIVVPRLRERRQDGDSLGYTTAGYGVASTDAQKLEHDQEGYEPASGEAVFGSDASRLEQDDIPEELSFDPLLDELVSSEHRETE